MEEISDTLSQLKNKLADRKYEFDYEVTHDCNFFLKVVDLKGTSYVGIYKILDKESLKKAIVALAFKSGLSVLPNSLKDIIT